MLFRAKQPSISLCVAVATLSCARPTPTIRPMDVAGSWARPGDAFPPVNLTLTDSGQSLLARLQLSGTDARGRAVLDGNRLRVTLDERPGEITGEFISATELRLQFHSVAAPYTLYRTDYRADSDRFDAADGSLGITVKPDGLHVLNLTDSTFAWTAYDRQSLLVRSTDRDPCMESPVAQCPSLEPRMIKLIPLSAVIGHARGTREIALRYWATDRTSEYPRAARVLVVRLPNR